MKVLIVTGGTSPERKISLLSAKSVKAGLKAKGHIVQLFDLKKGEKQLKNLAKKFDVIFPVIHGEEGEGGKLQKFLSTLGKPFVGGAPRGFKQGWYKIPFKRYCEQNNIPTSPWKKIFDQNGIIKFGFPCVLKSSSGGSSKEVVILKSSKGLKDPLCKKLLESNLPLFVEQYLSGIEITVGILNNQPLPVIEIVPPEGSWFDYKNKYSGATREIPHAPSLDKETKKLVQKIALQIHQTLDLGPYSRIDFIVTGRKPYVLEVNTIPGLTSQSLFPKAAQAAVILFPKLLDKIIKLACENKFLKPNDPLFKKVAKEIPSNQLNSPQIKKIAELMLKIIRGEQKKHRRGVGLAAPQIGILKRIILVDTAANGKGPVGNLRIYINPKIIWKSKRKGEWYEGCFSTGRIYGIVSRPTSIKIKAFIITPPGCNIREVEEKHTGYVARIFQHAIDHLNGKVFIDHIKNPDNLHYVEEDKFPLYRNQETWKNWPKKYPYPLLKEGQKRYNFARV